VHTQLFETWSVQTIPNCNSSVRLNTTQGYCFQECTISCLFFYMHKFYCDHFDFLLLFITSSGTSDSECSCEDATVFTASAYWHCTSCCTCSMISLCVWYQVLLEDLSHIFPFVTYWFVHQSGAILTHLSRRESKFDLNYLIFVSWFLSLYCSTAYVVVLTQLFKHFSWVRHQTMTAELLFKPLCDLAL
jgi:hypothetical protein